MKKFYSHFMSFVILLSMAFSIHAKAAELPMIINGYTEDGAYYEVYGEYVQPDATTMPITRYVTYKGNVTPARQLPWKETIGGIEYSGTLTLITYSYMRKDNITVATYEGILTYYLNQ